MLDLSSLIRCSFFRTEFSPLIPTKSEPEAMQPLLLCSSSEKLWPLSPSKSCVEVLEFQGQGKVTFRLNRSFRRFVILSTIAAWMAMSLAVIYRFLIKLSPHISNFTSWLYAYIMCTPKQSCISQQRTCLKNKYQHNCHRPTTPCHMKSLTWTPKEGTGMSETIAWRFGGWVCLDSLHDCITITNTILMSRNYPQTIPLVNNSYYLHVVTVYQAISPRNHLSLRNI